ncbi:MAG: hypothetical protein ACREF7_02040, partial [Candidatus Saccharimonadales bacterium]
ISQMTNPAQMGLGGAPNYDPYTSIMTDTQAQSLVTAATSHLPGTASMGDRLSHIASNPGQYQGFMQSMTRSGTYSADVMSGATPAATKFNFSDEEFESLHQQAMSIAGSFE